VINTLAIARALADPARLRALLALRSGELCLCHLIGLLELAPSTVSKHMELLVRAGLVSRRKRGRWVCFQLAGRTAPPGVRRCLRWLVADLADDRAVRQDTRRLRTLRKRDPLELVACYR
jgi:ArsR family transcriptional regulator, arsenate/arsenite/antimonite-responsive transcriptional repressor